VLEPAKRYTGYTAYDYLEPGVDFREFRYAEQIGRVPAYTGLDLSDSQRERALRLLTDEIVISLHDHVQVFPGHGSGSACGKALGAVPSTTVGYERNFAWWGSYLASNDEAGFIAELLDGQPDAHAYFARMKRQNRDGAKVLGPLPELVEFTAEQIIEQTAANDAVFVDTRGHLAVAEGTVAGALAIPAIAKMANFGAWAFDPEADDRQLILFAEDLQAAQQMRDHLMRVGIDAVSGYATSLEGLPAFTPPSVTPAELENFEHALLLDVRNRSEFAAGAIPNAKHISGGRALWSLDVLPADGKIVTYCQSGLRNSIVASALRDAGYDVIELAGSYAGWAAAMHKTNA